MSADIVARGMAAAQARSSSTMALVNAVRSNGFSPLPSSRLAANDTPAITIYQGQSNINAAYADQPTVLASNPKIKWLSGPTTSDGSGAWYARGAWYGSYRISQYCSLEFNHTGTTLELAVVGSFYQASNNLRILVNDTVAGVVTVPWNDGAYRFVKLVFPASGTRRIRVEGAAGKFRGINVASSGEIAATGRNYPLITVMGDSFVEGTGASFSADGEGVVFARALGCNLALGGVGGTGILSAGGKVNWTDPTRLTDLTMSGVVDAAQNAPTAPAMGVVMMSINDISAAQSVWGAYGSSFQAAINNRVWAVIDAWAAANPGKPLLFFGPSWTNSSPILDIYRIRDATQEACAGARNFNVWFVDRLNPDPSLRSGLNSFISTTGTTTSGSTSVTAIASTASMAVGQGIEGAGIAPGARIASIVNATSITIDPPASASAAGVALTVRTNQTSLYGFAPGDLTHPGSAGHLLDGLWMAQQARRLILSEFA